jgi:hypothetical protein
MAGVSIQITSNINSELKRLESFPKKINAKLKKDMMGWYNDDFKPYMGRVIRGFRAKDVPARNAEPYATYKETGVWTDRKGRTRMYNVVRTSPHSLGEVGKQWGRYAHSPGQLYRGAMAVKPRITITSTGIRFKAEFNKPFYLPIVHDGGYNLKKAYPFIDAALFSKYERLVRRIDKGIKLIWET